MGIIPQINRYIGDLLDAEYFVGVLQTSRGRSISRTIIVSNDLAMVQQRKLTALLQWNIGQLRQERLQIVLYFFFPAGRSAFHLIHLGRTAVLRPLG